MTEKEFDKTAFSKDMKFKYGNKTLKLKAVDFLNRDFGLSEHEGLVLIWLHCTHVKMIKNS